MKKLLLCYLFSLTAIVCQAADVEINSLSDLHTFRDNVNAGNNYSGKTVALMCDLKVDAWTPIGLTDDDTHTFQGTFEGNGHTVIINVNTSAAVAGFFGYLRGTVQHLKVVGSVLCTNTTTSAAGGIAGYNHGGTISQCANLATVIGYICGGIAGENASGGTISNCYNTGYIGSNGSATHLAGIAGKNNDSTIDHVYASCAVESISGSYAAITASGNEPSNAYHNVLIDGSTPMSGAETLTGTALEGHLNSLGNYTIWRFTGGFPELITMYSRPVYLMNDTDNTPFLETYQSQTRTVQLMDRTLLTNNWNTLCLPFALTAEQITTAFGAGTQVMTLSGYSNDGTIVTITFANAETIEAGKPYIVKPTVANPIFTGVTIDKTMRDVAVNGTSATFKGTYEPVVLTGNNRRWLFLASNMLWYPTADVTVNSCRAYFQLTDEVPENANNASRFVILFEETTSLNEELRIKNEDSTDTWYSLGGLKFNGKPTTKGLYIHNGRKEVLR